MQRSTLAVTFSFIVACLIAVPAATADECMDCGEKVTQRYTASGEPIYPQRRDALCCDFPCYDEDYVVRNENVGWGCKTCVVANEVVEGTICCSTREDLGCPADGGGGGWGGGFNDGTGCVRDASGACPADCTSCT